jgi:hypothetical protein
MNSIHLQQRMHNAFNSELCRRLLIRYFTLKGYTESFNKKIYPPTIQDLSTLVPQLQGRVEIEPFVEDIDPNSGVYKLGWNLFVLGTKRLYLGVSSHTSLAEVRSSIGGPLDGASKVFYATPNRVINFITAVLSKSESGDISQKLATKRVQPLFITGDHSGYFRTQQRPIN